MYPTPEQFAKIDIPILTVTGHYDGDQTGAMHYYRDHMRYGSAPARERHHLIMGPCRHALAESRGGRVEVRGGQHG
jgi:hypothetical protein